MAGISKRVSGAWQNTSYGIRGTATDTITTLPTTIYSDGTNATVSIKGNAVQSGTPTPDSPIMPQGTGERTRNLFDIASWIAANGTTYTQSGNSYTFDTEQSMYSTPYYFSETDIAVSISGILENVSSGNARIDLLHTDGTVSSGNVITDTVAKGENIYAAGLRFNWSTGGTVTLSNIMLNYGSTALPYEPYGYKIPILSADTTTNNYLGEVETTRKIKKLVLDGTETITEESTNVYSISITDTVTTGTGLSTHFEYDSTVSAGQFRIEAGKAVFGYNDTLTNFSTFLAAQYASGTPVTIWYILATETTGIVNEPLMRIGDYADEVSGVSIPTTDGANTLSVDTTVQPSEVSINYHGWHMGTVHEHTSEQWD